MWMAHPFQADFVLVGQIAGAERKVSLTEVSLPLGILVGVLVLGIGVFVWVRRWRQEYVEDSSSWPQHVLSHYEKMVEEGSLHPDEFARIKARLDQKASNDMSQPGDASSSIKPPTEIPPTAE
jgi:hypothetical protein